jgi:hypothetical protein
MYHMDGGCDIYAPIKNGKRLVSQEEGRASQHQPGFSIATSFLHNS